MMGVDDPYRAAELLEKLLTDPQLRADFRRNPASIASQFGLAGVAAELSASGKALHTLEIRESRSSLAGVMMAAAAEGVGIVELTSYVSGHGSLTGDAAAAVNQAILRASSSMQAVSSGSPGAAGLDGAPIADVQVPGSGTDLSPEPAPGPEPIDGPEPVAGPEPATSPEPAAAPEPASDPEPPPAQPEPAASAPQADPPAEPSQGEGSGSAASPPAADPELADLPSDGPAPTGPGTMSMPAAAPAHGASATVGELRAVGSDEAGTTGGGSEDVAPVEPQGAPASEDALLAAEQVVPTGVGGAVPPIAIADLAGSNSGGLMHGSEFDVPDPEGAPRADGVTIHAGYDLFANPGAPVRAPISGTVVEVKPSVGNSGQIFGGVVKIQDAEGRVWVFRHVDPGAVTEGMQVASGQQIAAITAWDGGQPHTHMELWKSLDGGYQADNMLDPLTEIQGAYTGQPVGIPAAIADSSPVLDEPGAAAAADPLAQLAALADNPRLALPPELHDQLAAGAIDPRLVSVLGSIAERHEVQLAASDTGIDIVSVDGQPVGPDNIGARDLVSELAALDPDARPAQVGTPWPIDAPGFQSSGDFQSRIHVAFAQETAGRESGVFAAAAGEAAAAPGHVGTVGFLQAIRVEDSAAGAPAGDLAAAAAAAPLTGGAAVAVAAVAEAEKYLGTPYLWGGEAPETGFDCSGLTQYVFGKLGVDLPRVAQDQFGVGLPVEQAQLQPGDLVFFQDETGQIFHEGIYIGNGQFLHAPHTGDVVKISELDDPYYTERFAGARRVADLADPNVPIPADLMPAVQAAAAPVGAPLPEPEAVGRQSGVFAAVGEDTAPAARHITVGIPAVQPDDAAAAGAPSGPLPDAAMIAGGPGAYPGDGASKEAIAAWMARRAQEAGLPPELPVMAGLVESGLFNNPGGDADSVGFFQMRVSIWDQGPYAGYQTDPEKQLQWFIDQALALRARRIEQGFADFGQDPKSWGTWIADVERPAEQYRGRYQLRLDEARHMLASSPTPPAEAVPPAAVPPEAAPPAATPPEAAPPAAPPPAAPPEAAPPAAPPEATPPEAAAPPVS